MNSSYQILPITLESLPGLQIVLNQSADEEVSIADEVEYFDALKSKNWFFAQNNTGLPVGLIRSFEQNSEWSLAELYVAHQEKDRAAIARELLQQFQKNSSFASGHRLRFDLNASDQQLNEVLKQEGFSQKQQTFKYLEHVLNEPIAYAAEEVSSSAVTAKEVSDVLSHLHPVTEAEAVSWLRNGSLRFAFQGTDLVSVAQIYESGKSLEINRIATHEKFLRQSHGQKLIRQILAEAQRREKDLVYLKVEDVRHPAIALYKKMGFIEAESKTQTWHSRRY